MTKSPNKWKKLSQGEHQSFWQTPKDKNGESEFVFRLRGMYLYFDLKEFSELFDMIKEVENTICEPRGDCYR